MNLERLERLEQILFLGRYEVNKETGEVYSKYLKRNLSACADGDGYLFVNFSYGTKRYAYKIHELVAYVNGVDVLDKTVNHIDGNVLNNHPSNLESLSREDNVRYRHSLAKVGLSGTPITPERRKAIKCCYENGFTIEELANIFSTHTQSIELALSERNDRSLDNATVIAIRNEYATGKTTIRKLAKKYSTNKSTVEKVLNFKSYQDVV